MIIDKIAFNAVPCVNICACFFFNLVKALESRTPLVRKFITPNDSKEFERLRVFYNSLVPTSMASICVNMAISAGADRLSPIVKLPAKPLKYFFQGLYNLALTLWRSEIHNFIGTSDFKRREKNFQENHSVWMNLFRVNFSYLAGSLYLIRKTRDFISNRNNDQNTLGFAFNFASDGVSYFLLPYYLRGVIARGYSSPTFSLGQVLSNGIILGSNLFSNLSRKNSSSNLSL